MKIEMKNPKKTPESSTKKEKVKNEERLKEMQENRRADLGAVLNNVNEDTAQTNQNSENYHSSYTNYLNVAMTDLYFQMGADVEDVDELLEMMKYQPESQPLQLINPAGYFRERFLPADADLPSEIKTDETIPLNKGYYKGIIFNIPGAEVLINGERVPFDNENSTLIKSQNPFTLERRLNGELSKQLGCEGSIEGSIQAVDDERNGFNHLNKTITLTLKGDVSGIDGI